MTDRHARDAWFEVELDLPNGKTVKGRSIPFRTGLALKQKIYKFADTMEQADFDDLWKTFEEATGVTEAECRRLCPDMTLLEVTDLVSRFIYVLRPGRTAAQKRSGTPDATAAPATGPDSTAGSAASNPVPVSAAS